MGVTGLWRLIEPSGKPVPVDTLENKILAIDISIWLHQVIKGYQDGRGGAISNAHLLGLFHRLCKLLYYRVRPVFVFDGGIPQLKRETIAKRNQSRNKLLNEAERLQQLLLQNLAKEKVVQQALGPNTTEILKSPVKQGPPPKKPNKYDDLFKLPSLPESEPLEEVANCSECSTSESEQSFEDHDRRKVYNQNIQTIDVTSDRFKNLPPDMRYEILTDIKETRKQNSWGKLHEFPLKGNNFSEFQMKRLLKRRQVQVSLEEAEQQMGGRSLTLSELRSLLNEDGVIRESAIEASTQIASDENTRFIFVKDLKKAIEEAEKREAEEKEQEEQEREWKEREAEAKAYISELQKFSLSKPTADDNSHSGDECDIDIQTAIQLSLESSGVYKADDYVDAEAKLNPEQRKTLKSAMNLARAYMIEYGGLNDSQVNDLVKETQVSTDDEFNLSVPFQYNDEYTIKGTPFAKKQLAIAETNSLSKSENNKIPEDQPNSLKKNDSVLLISDSDSDSDLIEVTEDEPRIDSLPILSKMKENQKKNIEIVIDLSKDPSQSDDCDDIFSDIFSSNSETKISSETTPIEDLLQNLSKNSLKTKSEITSNKEDSKDSIPKTSPVIMAAESSSSIDNFLATVLPSDECPINIPKDKLLVKNLDNILTPNIIEKKAESETEPGTKVNSAANILSKLRNDLEKVSKITLNDIVCKSDEDELKCVDEGIAAVKEIIKDKNESESKSEVFVDFKDKIELNSTGNKIETIKKTGEIISLENQTLILKDESAKQEEVTKIESDYSENSNEIVLKSKDKVECESQPQICDLTGSQEISAEIIQTEDEKEDAIYISSQSPRSIEEDLEKNEKNKESNRDACTEVAERTNALSVEQLRSIADGLLEERQEIVTERNRQERMGTSITDKMSEDCMRLLKMFGVPFLVAPMEAEAQCAFLESAQLTDGTITDDSDIWLFGGRTVYKNFFDQHKHVMEFRVDNIEKLFNVDRNKLIQLALLVGSDYTTGISGIGAVTALEILSVFAATPPKEGETTEIMSILSSLRKFREWLRAGKGIGSTTKKLALRGKLKNIEINESFPSIYVVQAYLQPTVNDNRSKFVWGQPDVESIREFAKKTFGWTPQKTNHILDPVFKRMKQKHSQASIKNYFSVKSAISYKELKLSKRVQRAIHKMGGNDSPSDTEEPKKKKQVPKTLKSPQKRINSQKIGEIADVNKPKRRVAVSAKKKPNNSNRSLRK